MKAPNIALTKKFYLFDDQNYFCRKKNVDPIDIQIYIDIGCYLFNSCNKKVYNRIF